MATNKGSSIRQYYTREKAGILVCIAPVHFRMQQKQKQVTNNIIRATMNDVAVDIAVEYSIQRTRCSIDAFLGQC